MTKKHEFLGLSQNRFGTFVSKHRCGNCGNEFTVCPPANDPEHWGGCLSENCASYDINRDVDALLFFGVARLGLREGKP